MGDNFLAKSFLFEIVNSDTQKIDRSFTLVLPPQSYTIKEKARVTITKTFGNAFIDDYGADNIEMTIKGISGTAHVFPTFKPEGASKGGSTFAAIKAGEYSSEGGYRHIEAFYVFRDDIMRYRDREQFDQKELRVYDLADQQAYKAVLLEFTLDRNADRPFHYPFTISLFIYARLNAKEAYSPKKIDIGKNPVQTIDNMDEGMESLSDGFKVFENVQNIRNQIALVQNNLRLLRARINTWVLRARLIVESPLLVTKQVIDGMTTLMGVIYDAYQNGLLAYNSYVNAEEMIQNQIRESLAIYGFSVQEGAQQQKEEYVEIDAGMDYETSLPISRVETFAFDGVNLYTVKGGDTLQSIAQDQMGDDTQWIYIASINDIGSNDDLVVGEQIYIPISIDQIASNKDTFIITEDTFRDPYGADIKIDSSGNIILRESNDVAIITGLANVQQAVDLMLSTLKGSMIKQTAYGLLIQPGLAGTEQAISYIRMGIEAALIQDPRIEQVQNLQVRIDRSDTFYISCDIFVVGQETSLPISVIL